MKNKKQGLNFTFNGFVGFALMIFIVSSISILSFTLIYKKTNSLSLTIGLCFLIIMFLIIVFLTIDAIRRKITVDRPVKEIVDATEKITKGDFKIKLYPKHNFNNYNEFDKIKVNINQMTQALSKIEMLKNDFIANLSHEIKTPLTIIQNYTTALMDKKLDKNKKNEYLHILYTTSKKLTNLVTNILKLNKLENQTLKFDMKNLDYSEILRECIINFENLIEEKHISLKLNIEELSIYSDENLLQIIINNLISNAIKFTKNEIEISLLKEENFAILSVKDNGIGMTSEVANHIFEKFYQGDTSHSKEGNGLGLALVKKAIDSIGGEINVESEVDKGTNFTIKLRLK